jgi:osmotically-inducible protein OsmY
MSQTKDIRDAVERELSYDPLVDDSGISVKNINGDVALNGTVPIITLAGIAISTDADPIDVTLDVQAALDRDALIPDDSVTVGTSANTVTLTGHVRLGRARRGG